MGDKIYLLDFRRGTVEEIDNTSPPKGLKGPAPIRPRADEVGSAGYVLTTLGSSPGLGEDDDEAEDG